MSGDHDGTYIDLASFEYALFTFRWNGADAIDGTIRLQYSDSGNDGTWNDLPSSQLTVNAASGSHYYDVAVRSGWYYRFDYKAGSNTTGTYSTFVRGKVPT